MAAIGIGNIRVRERAKSVTRADRQANRGLPTVSTRISVIARVCADVMSVCV